MVPELYFLMSKEKAKELRQANLTELIYQESFREVISLLRNYLLWK